MRQPVVQVGGAHDPGALAHCDRGQVPQADRGQDRPPGDPGESDDRVHAQGPHRLHGPPRRQGPLDPLQAVAQARVADAQRQVGVLVLHVDEDESPARTRRTLGPGLGPRPWPGVRAAYGDSAGVCGPCGITPYGVAG